MLDAGLMRVGGHGDVRPFGAVPFASSSQGRVCGSTGDTEGRWGLGQGGWQRWGWGRRGRPVGATNADATAMQQRPRMPQG